MKKDEKKIVFWGTGDVSVRISEIYEDVIPEFYIDNNYLKKGQIHLGRNVCHPSEIEDWSILYVVVVSDYYNEIENQLKSYGLTEGEDYANYHDFLDVTLHKESTTEIEKSLQFLKNNKENYSNKIFIFSDFLSYDKGICRFVEKWNEMLEDNEIILFSEATWISEEATRNKIAVPCIVLPSAFGKNRYIKENKKIKIDDRYQQAIDKVPYLKWSAENLRLRHQDMCKDYEFFICYYAEYYIKEVLRILKPQKVIIWNAFHAFHNILRNICMEEKVPVLYMEFGNIPGTIMIEEQGQMGESYPACNPDEFKKIHVTQKELSETEKIWDYLYKSRINRNAQPENDELIKIKRRLMPNRPVIFYAGQNDFESGLQPYNENSKEYHSPVFQSSDMAAMYLAGLCEKNEWNFIYKPHPIMKMFVKSSLSLPDSSIIVDRIDINDVIDISDLVVTILSTVSYITLIRKKPVLMLGYTQLKDKGCTYQAFSQSLIENEMINALKNGFIMEQKKAFTRHIAQMLRYCSFDDGSKRPIRYGKRIEELIYGK